MASNLESPQAPRCHDCSDVRLVTRKTLSSGSPSHRVRTRRFHRILRSESHWHPLATIQATFSPWAHRQTPPQSTGMYSTCMWLCLHTVASTHWISKCYGWRLCTSSITVLCLWMAYGVKKEVKRFGTLQPQSFHGARSWGNELDSAFYAGQNRSWVNQEKPLQGEYGKQDSRILEIKWDVHMILHRSTWIASTSQDAMRIWKSSASTAGLDLQSCSQLC